MTPAPMTPVDTTPRKRISIGFLCALAILISVASLGYSFYLCKKVETTSSAIQSLSHASTQTATQLQSMQNSITTQSHHTKMIIQFLAQWANLQLNEHHVAAALKALQLAQQYSTHATLNAAIQADITALQAIPLVNRDAIMVQLIQISESIQQLSSTPAHAENIAPTNGSNWHDKFSNGFSKIKNLFVIRHLDSNDVPLLDSQLEFSVKQNIIMQLTLAEWGLLHHDDAIFQTALKSASQMVMHYFLLSPNANTIKSQLDSLSKTTINPRIPTLSNTLTALSQLQPAATSTSASQSQ